MPSDVEGMPLSLLEAMSYGCTCLVSNIEENTQVTREYAKTFNKSSIEDLKNVLYNMLNTKRRKKEEIRNYILKSFNWEKVERETKEIYERSFIK